MKRTVTTTEINWNTVLYITIGVIVGTYLLFAALLASGLIRL